LVRPAIAATVVVVVATVGFLIAHNQADRRERRQNALLYDRYIESVDPVAMAASLSADRP